MSKVLVKIKEFGKDQRYSLIIKSVSIIIISALVMTILFLDSYSENLNKGLAENLIRLHVVAHSDSPEDQEIKSNVRDKVLEYMQVQLNSSRDLEQTKYIINKNLDIISKIAEETVANQGKNYQVKAALGSYPFPTKSYGDVVLPAGNYQALRVVIGKGEGSNWWCVLFPPLCFVDVTHGTIPDSVKKDLKDKLSSEEYLLITSSDSGEDIPVKIKFKIVEVFQSSKNKFTGVLNKLLKPGE
jgi:stage II sporulation protein R